MNDRIKYKKGIFHKRYLHRCSRYKTSIRDNWFNYHTANSKSLTWLGKRNRRNYNYCHVAKSGTNGFILGKGWYEYGCKLEQLQKRVKSKERRRRTRVTHRRMFKNLFKNNPIYLDEFEFKGDN